MFSRDFRTLKRAKVKSIFEIEWHKVGKLGCVPRWLLGLIWGFPGASAQIVHQDTKIACSRLFGAIAFPHCFQISVLRAFSVGLFGFIGFRCVFGCPVAFVALVGLYACSVRRLEVKKRKPRYFLGFIGFIGFIGFLGFIGLL